MRKEIEVVEDTIWTLLGLAALIFVVVVLLAIAKFFVFGGVLICCSNGISYSWPGFI